MLFSSIAYADVINIRPGSGGKASLLPRHLMDESKVYRLSGIENILRLISFITFLALFVIIVIKIIVSIKNKRNGIPNRSSKILTCFFIILPLIFIITTAGTMIAYNAVESEMQHYYNYYDHSGYPWYENPIQIVMAVLLGIVSFGFSIYAIKQIINMIKNKNKKEIIILLACLLFLLILTIGTIISYNAIKSAPRYVRRDGVDYLHWYNNPIAIAIVAVLGIVIFVFYVLLVKEIIKRVNSKGEK